MNLLIKFINLIYTAFLNFTKDKMITKSNSIAYSIVIAIIPLLTVLIRIANLNQRELIEYITRFFAIYGITGVQPVLDIIQDILSRANTISGIGFLFLIYAILKIFQDLEEIANQVFEVESRGFLIRTSVYTSWMIFLPIIILFMIDFSRKVEDFLKPPDYIEIKKNNKNFFLLREDMLIEIYNSNFEKEALIDFLTKVDFLSLNRKIIINQEPLDFDLTGNAVKTFLKKPKRIEVSKDFIVIVCEPSFIIFSLDSGISWDFRYFVFSNKGKSFELPTIEDIHVVNDNLLVLLSFSNQTYFFILDKEYLDIKNRYVFDSFYNKIYFYENKIFLSGQGSLLYSEISPISWNLINISNLNTTFENFYLLKDFSIFLSATKRILIYENGIIQFPSIKINQLENINNFKIFSNKNGFIYGKKELRYTINGGKEWFVVKTFDLEGREQKINFTIQDLIESNTKDHFILIGKNQSIYGLQLYSISIDPKIDLPIVKLKLTLKQEISKARNLLPSIVTLILNYLYIVIILFFFYMILPNKKIPILAAFTGGVISSLGIVLFIVLFKLILPFFSSSRFVYGIWFTVPIGMMILLTTIQIFLYGLEIVKLVSNPDLIQKNVITNLVSKIKNQ